MILNLRQVRRFIPAFLTSHIDVILLAFRKFNQRHGRWQSASMTYYSALSLVPSLTLIYGLMKGFGLEGLLRDQLYHNLSSHRQLIDAIFTMAQDYVDKTQGTILAGIGLALLFWGVLQTLNTMEEAFNDIWGITSHKNWVRKLSDDLAVFLICPTLIILSGSVTIFVSAQAFGFLAGAMYQATQWCYVGFQAWINRANAIYGSLAAIPLFLVWLEISWAIMLLGAQVCFVRQWPERGTFGPSTIHPSPSLRKQMALLLTYVCVKNFEAGNRPSSTPQLAAHLQIPISLTHQILEDLVALEVLNPIARGGSNQETTYQPAKTIDKITVKDIWEGLEHRGEENLTMNGSSEYQIIRRHFAAFNQCDALHTLVKDLGK